MAMLRRALDEIVEDQRFAMQKTISALEIAEHLLARAATGERDLERLKASAFIKLLDDRNGVQPKHLQSKHLRGDGRMIPRSDLPPE
ncbi:hypothetical protein [Tardiphaga sp.]|uniref:hypothetical protein n=1 Tax=Tardiphaga sp. TaxID=1926292 RepID=UPI00260595F2|nr:hypothetical protein [Tardiphaga sp.]